MLWVNSNDQPFDAFGTLPVVASRDLENTSFSETYIKEFDECIIDNLNLLYVAFTRAGRELFVYGPSVANENYIASLFKSTLSKLDEWTEPENPALPIVFTSGTSTSAPAKNKSEDINIYQPAVREPSAAIANTDYTPAWPELSTPVDSKEIRFGKHVHESMASIRKVADVEKVITKLSMSEEWSRTFADFIELENAVNKTWQLMAHNGWTDPRYTVFSEVDICDRNGNVVRPDRVLVDDDKAIVIDFKTGAKEEEHHKQVATYMELLLETGIKEVEGYLLYTDELKTVQVAFPQ
jgi:ATP-dependent exoDNAse (exonuclease V) beta subunit